MSDRLAALRAMVDSNGDDVFARYALGMEYAALRRFDDACRELAACIRLDASYLPAYVEAGKAHRAAGRLKEATEWFLKASELAARTGDAHAADRIRGHLEGLA